MCAKDTAAVTFLPNLHSVIVKERFNTMSNRVLGRNSLMWQRVNREGLQNLTPVKTFKVTVYVVVKNTSRLWTGKKQDQVSLCVLVCACVSMCMHVYESACVYMYVVTVCICEYMCMCMREFRYISIYIDIYMYVCMCDDCMCL